MNKLRKGVVIPPMDLTVESFHRVTNLHGRAWLAVLEWCEAVLGTKFLDKHDRLFTGRVFFSPTLMRLASQRVNWIYAYGRRSWARERERERKRKS